eukprot:TRINITY_DN0_c165_g1_i7.p1 TRINITY_DN0_c165_g1~~TRINITY_DN0_c165_g1_i7.p1  ORF type:complete len:122 (-),score=24.47 TRINITY_DN0_c165_g1_i7:97-462(-)
MNSFENSSKLYSPKPIRITPKSVTYSKPRSLTNPIQYRITLIPSRVEDWPLERLGEMQMNDDGLAAMAEMESELLKRTASFPLIATKKHEGFSSCRSCSDFSGIERPSNPMARALDEEVQD